MGDLHRTVPTRCTYCQSPDQYAASRQYEWFWGRSDDLVDVPAVVAMTSHDGSKAIAIGYQDARSASQNADAHHCIHSRPHFGNIAPGASVTRKGYIMFGDDAKKLTARLKSRIS